MAAISMCGAQYDGTTLTCVLAPDHKGPHRAVQAVRGRHRTGHRDQVVVWPSNRMGRYEATK